MKNKIFTAIAVLLGIFVALGVVGVIINYYEAQQPVVIDNSQKGSEDSPVVDEPNPADPGSWKMDLEVGNGHTFGGDTKVLTDGFQSIRQAKNKKQARKALDDLIEVIKRSPKALAGYVKVFLGKEVKARDLYKKNKVGEAWATDKAIDLVDELKLYLAAAKISKADAPKTGFSNTGINKTGFVQSRQPGITGDRSSVKIVGVNGKTVYVLARCANPVVKKKVFPKGQTDEHEPDGSEVKKKPQDPDPKTNEEEPDGSEQPKLSQKSKKKEDYGMIQGAPEAETTGETTAPVDKAREPGESSILDNEKAAAQNLTVTGAADTKDIGKLVKDAVGGQSQVYVPNTGDTNSPGRATTTVIVDQGGDANKDVTNNVGDTSVPVGVPTDLPPATDGNDNGVVRGSVPID